ncbi:MAG: hypothetical protein C4617_00985 [Candidatus Liberibacter europaeus]|uniref:Endonuclease/exonuclease/phosphatase domain-containing protein n=1 Tax=Candidatus Liberibacter europaeus TaxID=744859 RepID=A0A2T4VZ01_9HYPH|nr:hypothetical protein [Candidatus Liberibacter europaeus]PTL87010.1 MAG: hypothetical protein C4617_00985 [Candidatus Liberibacter europaeus]
MSRYIVFIFLIIFIPNENRAQKVRIASWNINTLSEKSGHSILKNSIIREDRDYDILRNYAQEIGADIVSMQEMGSYNAVKRIFPEDKWEILFSGNSSWENLLLKNGNGQNIHTAIVVRKDTIKILKTSYLSMNTEGMYQNRGSRKAIEMLFEVNGKEFWLLGIHLKSFCFLDRLENQYNSSCSILKLQIDWLKEWINKKKASNTPFIIAGDFNRKMNNSGNNDEAWLEINQNNDLIRYPSYKRSKCRTASKYKNSEPIDFFVMNQIAYRYFIKGSFSEFLYRDQDIKEIGRRLSDHCPIIIDYDFH